MVTRHMTICAGSAIALESVQPSVQKIEQTAGDRNATLTAAIVADDGLQKIAGFLILGSGDRA